MVLPPMYIDGPYGDVHFPCNIPPMLENLHGTKILTAVEGHVAPQDSKQVNSLTDSHTWIAAEHEEMESIANNKVICCTSPF